MLLHPYMNVRYCLTKIACDVDVQGWRVIMTYKMKREIWTYTIGVKC